MDSRVDVAVDEATDADNPAERLRGLRRFTGAPPAFWAAYLELTAAVCAGRRSFLLQRTQGAWRVSYQWARPATPANDALDGAQIRRVAEAAAAGGYAGERPEGATGGVAVRIDTGAEPAPAPGGDVAVLVILLDGRAAFDAASRLEPLLRLAADVPAQYEMGRQARRASGRVERLTDVIALAIRIGNERRFVQVAFTLCNELATRFNCDRVSLGWLEGPYVRVKAVSHTEKFDGKMAAAQQLEAVMEEAFDQDEDILFPPVGAGEGGGLVLRAHDLYAQRQGAGHLLSLPIRVDDEPEAVLTAERRARPFTEAEALEFRVVCDSVARRLADLHHADRWFGSRAALWLKETFGRLWGVEHSLAKLAAATVVMVVVAMALIPWQYRIEAPLTLRTDDLVFLPAPFDGYLRRVEVEVGDPVKAGDVLAALDTSELQLEEAAVAAEVLRYAREAEKAQAARSLADMQIAQAKREQAAVHLERVRYNLAHARITAPMDGIVVEGDLKQSIGAPARKGDLLFKVARIERTYIEVEIDESDVHEVSVGDRGEAAMVGRPDARFPFTVERLAPMATLKDSKNRFTARTRLDGAPEGWWRPGMTGTAKIDVGERSILWIASHRTLRFLRKVFWL